MKISHSEVDAYLLCERKDYYGAGLGLQRKKLSVSLNRGIVMHDILAHFFAHLKDNPRDYAGARQAANDRKVAIALSDPNLLEIMEDITRMFEAFWRIRWFEGYKVITVEEKYNLQISDELSYPFTVDLILEDPGGFIAVVDHKTTYDFYQQHQIELNSQLPKYIGALRVLGQQADYAIYHQLRYRTAKSHTDADVIRIETFTPTVSRIQTTFTEQIETARRLLRLRSLPIEGQSARAIRTANNLVCNHCSFKDLCVAELNGQPIDLIVQAQYEPRKDRYEDVE